MHPVPSEDGGASHAAAAVYPPPSVVVQKWTRMIVLPEMDKKLEETLLSGE